MKHDTSSNIDDTLSQLINTLIFNYENPDRIAFSKKYSFLKQPIIVSRQLIKKIQFCIDWRIKNKRIDYFYEFIVARHQSVLRRKLGTSDEKLQERKITNIRLAIKKLNGLVIKPNSIFSFWNTIGEPKYSKGYVDGMLLSNGNVIEGIGGGLCQLSNFLYWIFLHVPTQIIERQHHGIDVFPDSGRVLPFGSGATIFYNFIDLRVKNISAYPLQLKLWLTDKHLKGQVRSTNPAPYKIHIFEKNHFFIKRHKQYFRFNEIYKEVKVNGKHKKIEKIAINFAPVVYPINGEYFRRNGFRVIDFST